MRIQHMSVIAGISVLYGLVGFGNYMLTPAERFVDVHTWVDAVVPFMAIFAWPYLFYYMLLGVPLILMMSTDDMKLLWKRLAIASAISAMVFIAVPTTPLRMQNVELLPGMAPWIIAMIYRIDPPANCFPSLHVLHSFLVAATYARSSARSPRFRNWSILFYAMAMGVAFATVFIKQHFVADVVAALFLVPIVCWMAELKPLRLRWVEQFTRKRFPS